MNMCYFHNLKNTLSLKIHKIRYMGEEAKEGQFYKYKTKEPHIHASTEKKKKSTSYPYLRDDRIY